MKVSRTKLRELVSITLECDPEDRPFRGEFTREDGSRDHIQEGWVAAGLRAGNQWAWCVAHVTARYKDLEGEDYLGGCSYESTMDFIQHSGYYLSMIDEAVEKIAVRIEAIVDGPDIWVHANHVCLVCASEPP